MGISKWIRKLLHYGIDPRPIFLADSTDLSAKISDPETSSRLTKIADTSLLSSWAETFAPGSRVIDIEKQSGDQTSNLDPAQKVFLEGLQSIGILPKGDGQSGGVYDFGLLGPVLPWQPGTAGYPVSWDFSAMDKMMAGDPARQAGAVTDSMVLTKASRANDGIPSLPLEESGPNSIGTPRAVYWDPTAISNQAGYRDRPTWVTYSLCSTLTYRCTVIQDIIALRAKQAAAFAKIRRHKFTSGYRIRMRDHSTRLGTAERKLIAKMDKLLNGQQNAESFPILIQKWVRDTLTHDQIACEKIPDRLGRPTAWNHVDASTIRLAHLRKLYPENDPNAIFAVQIIDGQAVATFNKQQLAFGVRNPRTDRLGYGYGIPECEMALSAISTYMNAWNYNSNAFTQGTLQNVFLNLKGYIPDEKLQSFRRQFYLMTAGSQNGYRLPIMNSDGIEAIHLNKSNREMEFSAFLDFCIKLICGAFNTDPTEINLKMSQGGGKQMFEGPNKSKVTESKAKGMAPLLQFFADFVTTELFLPHSDEVELEFVGLESSSPKEQADLMTQRVRTAYTVDEIRSEDDLDPLPEGTGQILLDGNWLNNRFQMQMAKKQAAEAKAQAEINEAQMAALVGIDQAEELSPEELSALAQVLADAGQGMAGAGGGMGGGMGGGGGGGASATPFKKAETEFDLGHYLGFDAKFETTELSLTNLASRAEDDLLSNLMDEYPHLSSAELMSLLVNNEE